MLAKAATKTHTQEFKWQPLSPDTKTKPVNNKLQLTRTDQTLVKKHKLGVTNTNNVKPQAEAN